MRNSLVTTLSKKPLATQQVDIPAGYKQTELGVIPEDWDVKALQAICKAPITYGIVQCGPHVENGVPYIRVSDMNSRELDITEMLRTSPSIAALFSRSKVEEGDVVYALRGKLGHVRMIFRPLAGANLTQGTARISPLEKISNRYLFWTLQSPKSLEQAAQEAKGSTFVEITLGNLKRIKVPIPKRFKEQEAIANVLSDTDVLITGLEQLIAKKQAIKTATMQQLLTGHTLLPKFAKHPDGTLKGHRPSELGAIPEDWQVVPFKDVLTIKHGKNQKEVESPSGQYPIYATGGQIGNATSFLFDKPSVLIGRKGTIDKPRYTDIPFWTVDTLFYSEIKKNCSVKFIYYKFCMIDWMQYNEASGVPSLNAHTIENVLIVLPNMEEQTAIATILSDMDAELETLEKKLSKARDIKQGMMQQLLTGRIRLPLDHQP